MVAIGTRTQNAGKSAAETTVSISNAQEKDGYVKAKLEIEHFNEGEKRLGDRELIVLHVLVAAMQWEISRGAEVIGLLRYPASFCAKPMDRSIKRGWGLLSNAAPIPETRAANAIQRMRQVFPEKS